jgi:hypothetical protein
MLRQVWKPRLLPVLVAGALLGGMAHKLPAQAHPQKTACTSLCLVGSDQCPIGGYIIVVAPGYNTPNSRLSITNYCYIGLCDNCVVAVASRALVPEILGAVRAGDIDKLARAVVSNTHRVVLNVARQAIQITGCSDQQLVASIPVPPFEFAALQSSIASQTADLAAVFTDGAPPWRFSEATGISPR